MDGLQLEAEPEIFSGGVEPPEKVFGGGGSAPILSSKVAYFTILMLDRLNFGGLSPPATPWLRH